jgi:zinc and cadmium transporter
MTHLRLQLILSAVAGVMLGVATLHLVPHSARLMRSLELSMCMVLAGILFMFFLNRMLHFHQHGTAETGAPGSVESHAACGHRQEHGDRQILAPRDVSSWGLFVGMTIHTLLDGVALGAASAAHGHSNWSAASFSVFLAIALHKPLDAMSVTSLMAARRWSGRRIAFANVAIALTVPLGVLLFYWGVGAPTAANSFYIGAALAFAAGAFLCVSLGDLLPEVYFHKHDRLWLSTALLLGIAVSVIVELVPGHSHYVPTENTPAPSVR